MTHAASYDVIVAGAGPAGSAAACVLARNGARTLLLDRAVFPRDKLCAGLLTWKTVDILARLFGRGPGDLREMGVIEHRADRYRIRHRNLALACRDLAYPFFFVSRNTFDAWLVEQAVAAGAVPALGQAVQGVDAVRATVTTRDGRTYAAGYLIGADGASSVVRRAFPLDGAAKNALAAGMGLGLECRIGLDDPALISAHPDLRDDFPTIYSGFIGLGYGWLFPHGRHMVVGLGGLSASDGVLVRRAYADFLEFLGLPEAWMERSRAHLLPYGNFMAHPVHGRTLLAGDAAGLVETLFGEGIFYALQSGELAARAALAGLTGGDAARVYLDGLDRHVLPEMTGSLRLRNAIFASMRLGPLPLWCLLRLGGRRLVEMAHGVRSYRWLRRLAPDPAPPPRER